MTLYGAFSCGSSRKCAGAAASEAYRDAIEHEVGRELTSIARECRGQTSV